MDKPNNEAEQIAPKIKEFLTNQSKQQVKDGVDFVEIIRKLKDRKAKKKNG